MAKFLNTTGVSYHLEELIKGTKDRLILISPYLQFSERIKEHIKNLNIQKRDIRIIYRENKLQPDETNWLAEQIGVRTSLCKTLHAKCYLNEVEALVTSMNLYEFSQVNNNEMGIHLTKAHDPELYASVIEEAQRLLTISAEIRVTVQQVLPPPSAQARSTSESHSNTRQVAQKLPAQTYIQRFGTHKTDLKPEMIEARKAHPRAYESWTSEEEDVVVQLGKQRKSALEIGRLLGRQESAIERKLKDLL